MAALTDIREYKTNLRNKYKLLRKKMTKLEKTKLDSDIVNRFFRLHQYAECETVLVYVSTEIEVDTFELIKNAWKDGKKVAVPCCIPNSRKMNFYYISSFDDLEKGTFGVLEPKPSEEKLYNPADKSICVVPGLCFDKFGFRLGYGKGYYDRFLSGYKGLIVGICYSSCVKYHLLHGKYDCAVNILITENNIHNTALQKFNKPKHRFNKGE